MKKPEYINHSPSISEHLWKLRYMKRKATKLCLNNQSSTVYHNSNLNIININNTKHILLTLFLHYAEFSLYDNDFFISSQNIITILRNVNLLNSNIITLNDIDIILRTINPKGDTKLTTNEYYQFIVLLADSIDHINYIAEPKETITNIIKQFFEPYVRKLNHKIDYNDITYSKNSPFIIERNIKSFKFDEDTICLIESLILPLRNIFCVYFKNVINNSDDKKDSRLRALFGHLLEFCLDYEIYPKLLSLNKIALYYKYITEYTINNIIKDKIVIERLFQGENNNNLSPYFNLNKFVIFLVVIGLSIIDSIQKKIIKGESYFPLHIKEDIDIVKQWSKIDKLFIFFQKFNVGEGPVKTNKKQSYTYNKKFELCLGQYNTNPFSFYQVLPISMNKSSLSQLATATCDNNNNNIILSYTVMSTTGITKNSSQSYMNSAILEKSQKITKQSKYYSFLKDLFEYYALTTDKLQSNQLSYNDYIKVLQSFNIIDDKGEFNYPNKTKIKSNMKKTCTTFQSLINYEHKKTRSRNISRKNSLTSQESTVSMKKIPTAEELFITLCGSKGIEHKDNQHNTFYSFRSSKKSINHIQSKMSFNNFLQAFNYILYIFSLHEKPLDEGLFQLFPQNNILSFNSKLKEKTHIISNYNYIKENAELYAILIDLTPYIKIYYKQYTKNNYLNFDTFFIIYQDFGIFPHFINYNKLKGIFYSLINKAINDDIISIQSMNDNEIVMPFELFIVSLGVSALEINTSLDISAIERLVLLFEKIANEERKDNQQKQSGNTFNGKKEIFTAVNNIKESYPEIFNKTKRIYDYQKQIKSITAYDHIMNNDSQ